MSSREREIPNAKSQVPNKSSIRPGRISELSVEGETVQKVARAFQPVNTFQVHVIQGEDAHVSPSGRQLEDAPIRRSQVDQRPSFIWRLDRWRLGVLRLVGACTHSVALLVLLTTLTRAETKVGDVFPALASAGLVPLGSLEVPSTAGKVVLVDFWASWCAPCKASFPMMARLHQDFTQRGFVVTAIGIDEKPAAAAAFAKKLAPPFPTLHDREQKLVKQVVVPTMPTSYLIGRDGRVRFVHEGYHGDATDRELRKQIEQLLSEKI
jgi:thiol-disulfide isomerase/thioredoxin